SLPAGSSPQSGPACGHGGSCGVLGLVAVAQASPASIENLRMINNDQIESGFAQADLAAWAYYGTKMFAVAQCGTRGEGICSTCSIRSDTLEHALDGLSVPLHPGAAKFYQEQGLPVGNTPAAAGESSGQKQP